MKMCAGVACGWEAGFVGIKPWTKRKQISYKPKTSQYTIAMQVHATLAADFEAYASGRSTGFRVQSVQFCATGVTPESARNAFFSLQGALWDMRTPPWTHSRGNGSRRPLCALETFFKASVGRVNGWPILVFPNGTDIRGLNGHWQHESYMGNAQKWGVPRTWRRSPCAEVAATPLGAIFAGELDGWGGVFLMWGSLWLTCYD